MLSYSESTSSPDSDAYAEAAKNGYLVGASHLSVPGIGRLRAEGKGLRVQPGELLGDQVRDVGAGGVVCSGLGKAWPGATRSSQPIAIIYIANYLHNTWT